MDIYLYSVFLFCFFLFDTTVKGSIYANRRELDQIDLSDINAHYLQRSIDVNVADFGLGNHRSTRQMTPCTGTYIKTNGTTCHLKEIIIGRCNDYQYVKRNLYLAAQSAVKNCTELYEMFETAARYKAYCETNLTTYAGYLEKAFEGFNVINRAMFWSGTYDLAHLYSKGGFNYITLEDTLPGSIVDGLVWCGTEIDPLGYDYLSCPNGCDRNREANIAFWGLASKIFAQRVAGEVYVVLNGSRMDGRPTFRNNSIFSDYELPNFRRNGTDRVTKVNALVLHSPDLPVKEKCGNNSLKILENLVRAAQFEYSCIDDPDELLLLMCGDQRSARECRMAAEVLRLQWNSKLFGTSTGVTRSRTIFPLFAFLFYVVFLF